MPLIMISEKADKLTLAVVLISHKQFVISYDMHSDGIWHETSLPHQDVLKYVAYRNFFVKKWKDDHTWIGPGLLWSIILSIANRLLKASSIIPT